MSEQQAMPASGVVFQRDQVDVLLLLEGTYPYVAGGVSSWVHQIIRGFPQLRFGAVFIGSRPDDYHGMRYVLPDNLVYLHVVYLFDQQQRPLLQEKSVSPRLMQQVMSLHESFRQGMAGCPHAMIQAMPLLDQALPGGGLDEQAFLHSHQAWEMLAQNYRLHCTDPSFVDYFWTVRTIHTPLWILNRLSRMLPVARMYHTISTGYAGFLGAVLGQRQGKPLLVSEHGIYTKERKIDLYQAEWIRDNRNLFQRDPGEVGYFKQLWIRFYEVLARMAYDQAMAIVALYEQNRLRQVSEGAPEDKTSNIPNGIDLPRFSALRAQRPKTPPPVLCLIGRVVPIKDIKTFIRAMRSVVNVLPDAQGWIAGPQEEDPDYALECQELVKALGLEDRVHFLGFQKLDDILPKIGLNVLSSISEALPLVVLEGYAAGVPVVTTDVGSCRQLVEGLDEQDQALGSAGKVVRIADPQALADAALSLLTDEAAWQGASQAAMARVEAYYTQSRMFASYADLYARGLGGAWPG